MRASCARRRNAARSAPARPPPFRRLPHRRAGDDAGADPPSIFIRITESVMRFRFSRSSAVALLLIGGMASAGLAQTQTNTGPQNPGSGQGDTQPSGSEPPHGNPGATGDTGVSSPIGASPPTVPAQHDEGVAGRGRLPALGQPPPRA